jgi:hypothetical protein
MFAGEQHVGGVDISGSHKPFVVGHKRAQKGQFMRACLVFVCVCLSPTALTDVCEEMCDDREREPCDQISAMKDVRD